MANIDVTSEFNSQLADEHRRWLADFADKHQKAWNRLLTNNAEDAFCEALIRRQLQDWGILVTPNESLKPNGGGPDFRCVVGTEHFYIEATCIRNATATEGCGIPDEPPRLTAVNPSHMMEAVFNEAGGKATQCSNMDAPTLVAIGTFHEFAAMVCFDKDVVSTVLTGQTSLTWDIDFESGTTQHEKYQFTDLKRAAFFFSHSENDVKVARRSISGLLLIGLGTSADWLGVLHPDPVRPFAARLLPNVRFGRVSVDCQSRQLNVEWPNGEVE